MDDPLYATAEQRKSPWMAIAIDKNFSDARWQAQGPKLLEPTMIFIVDMQRPLKTSSVTYVSVNETS